MARVPIVQGEHHVAGEPGLVISTLLGSCVAACLHDPVAKLGGMNHFLLGEPGDDNPVPKAEMTRYGIHAMELLINGLMKRGAQRSRLRAHLYGGASIVANLGDIGQRNGLFARKFLQTEGIVLDRCELGGTQARKVEFMPYEGRVRSSLVRDVPLPPVAPVKPVVEAESSGELELF
ncbi:chemotaxis protein CheD [Novosphingobium profundi]|uniref:chemotaxis protein CheD n=1 Tax=Novosphingobium profundi TaxID=1774954 RepID=UPI001BDB1D4D|nr:chemotaxis protein CheD [Novosphingobium profundi]MBT0670550.1 chemotaxis protein CheD [Novosphingobium profundi]